MKLPVRALSVIAVFAVITGLFAGQAQAEIPPVRTAAGQVLSVSISLSSTYQSGYPVGQQHFETSTYTVTDGGTFDTLTDLAAGTASMGFDMTPPAGQTLHVGTYKQVDTFDRPGLATVRMSVGSDQADDERGDVEILDLAADSAGYLTRFDLVYRFGADHPGSAFFGEVRMGEPEPTDHVLSNNTIRWPLAPVGIAPVLATEWVRNTGQSPLTIGRPSVAGTQVGDFSLHGDNCPTSLLPSQYCTIGVGFSPHGSGERTGVLTWIIGGKAEHIALRGEAPDGFSELTSRGILVNNSSTQEFVDGKYVQLYARYSDNRGADFDTATTAAYEGTVWDGHWNFTVSAPYGRQLAVGTYSTVREGNADQWSVDITGGGSGCNLLDGKLTIRQISFNADATIARADMDWAGVCDPGAYYAKTVTAHLRYRSTITPPQYVNQPQVLVAARAIVPISGVAAPGSTVGVWFKSRTQPTFVQRRTLKVNSAGRFAASYQAMDDTTYYVTMGSTYLPVQYLTKVRAMITHAPAAAPRGSVVTVTGVGVVGQQVGLTFLSAGGSSVFRSAMSDAAGNWSYRYTAGHTLTIVAASEPDVTPSDPVTVTVTPAND